VFLCIYSGQAVLYFIGEGDSMDYLGAINSASSAGIVTPVIHWSMDILGRSKGISVDGSSCNSVICYASYCAGEKLQDVSRNYAYDWSYRCDVAYSKILLPDNAPKEYENRETLWNSVEKIEKGKNAQLARIVNFVLPLELDRDTQIHIVTEYVQENFVNRGMIADIAIHDNGTSNPHAHVILTMRSMDKDGQWLDKQQKQYILDKLGQKIYNKDTKCYKCGKSIKTNDWDSRCNVEKWRKSWADICNREFEKLGLDKRVTHISYKRQGVNLKPTKHLGSKVTAMERRGIRTKQGDVNRDIRLRNLVHISNMALKLLREICVRGLELVRSLKHQILQHQQQEQEASTSRKYERKYVREREQYERKYQQYERKYVRNRGRSMEMSL